jgi:hypothetical protein
MTVEKIIEYQNRQYNIAELIEYINENLATDGEIETAIFVYRKQDQGLFFILGSEERDYNFETVNWDLDKIKFSLLDGDFEC